MKIKTIEMSTAKFISIPSNPIQRDTRMHAEKAKKYHLSSDAITHQKVAIAKNGTQTWKLDGHTRALLWKEGDLTAPETVSVDVYPVENKNEAIELYKHFDNRDATESNSDKLSGALTFMGITNYNRFFIRNTGIISGIQLIHMALGCYHPRADVVQMLLPWKKELRMLINEHWTSNAKHGMPGVPAAVVSAYLVTVRMYGSDPLGFWDGYYNGTGSETLKSGRCGCRAAIDWIVKARKEDLIMGRQNSAKNAEALIRAYHIYRAKKPVTRLSELYKREHNKSFNLQFGDFLKDIGYPTK